MATTNFNFLSSGDLNITERLIPYVFTIFVVKNANGVIAIYNRDNANNGALGCFEQLQYATIFKKMTLEDERERWQISTWIRFYVEDTDMSSYQYGYGQDFDVYCYVYYINPEGKYELRKFKAQNI